MILPVIQAQAISKRYGEIVAVELLPKEPGEYEFACAMGMFRGRLVVE